MIYIDGIGLHHLIDEIKNEIVKYKLSKIYQYDKSSLSLYFGKKNLYFLISNNLTIFYLKEKKIESTDYQSKFLLSLKKYLLSSILINIRQEGYDRIIYFDFEKLNQFGKMEYYTLVFEIMGKSSNLFILSDGKILASLFSSYADTSTRITMKGAQYILPFNDKKLLPTKISNESFDFDSCKDMINKIEGIGSYLSQDTFNNFEKFKEYLLKYSPVIYNTKDKKILSYNVFDSFENEESTKENFPTLNSALDTYFSSTITSNNINVKKIALLKQIDQLIKKNTKIFKNIEIDLKKTTCLDEYKIKADILASNLHILKKGDKETKLFNFYDNTDIIIKLDDSILPKDNIDVYYKKYNKAKRTINVLEDRKKEIKLNDQYYKNIKLYIENENDISGLIEIENELNLKNLNNKSKPNKKNKRELLSFEHNEFKILVGRNNKENEEITFTKGNYNDIWLHIKDLPGSHILILLNNKKLNDDILLYAAKLAAKHSKISENNTVSVDYCEKRYVKKIKNSKPGNVIYTNYKTLTFNA